MPHDNNALVGTYAIYRHATFTLYSIQTFPARPSKHREQNPHRQEPILGYSRSSTMIHSKAVTLPRQNDDNNEKILYLESGIRPCGRDRHLPSFNSNWAFACSVVKLCGPESLSFYVPRCSGSIGHSEFVFGAGFARSERRLALQGHCVLCIWIGSEILDILWLLFGVVDGILRALVPC